MSIPQDNRTPERMGHFEAFLVMLEHEGYGDLPFPYSLPVDELRRCETVEEKWAVADRWLLGVRYSLVAASLNRHDESRIMALKRLVAGWRHQQSV